jgi:hypothetical protein
LSKKIHGKVNVAHRKGYEKGTPIRKKGRIPFCINDSTCMLSIVE